MIDGALLTRDFLLEGIGETAAWLALTSEEVASFREDATRRWGRVTSS